MAAPPFTPAPGDPAASAYDDLTNAAFLTITRKGFAYRAVFGGFLILIFGAAYLLPFGSTENDFAILLCAGLLTLVNGPYYLFMRRSPERVLRYRWVGLLVDLVAITAMIYFLGAMHAIYAFPFYAIIIFYSAVTHRHPWHYIVATFASLSLAIMYLATKGGLVRFAPSVMALNLDPTQEAVVVGSFIIFFFFTAAVAGLLSESLFHRSRALAAASAVIEAANRELETKIAARTREIEAQNVLLQRQNERIAEANRLKTEYLFNINHELRTPLTSILGYGRMLLTYALEPSRQREFIENILRQADALNGFVSTLNQIEEIEAGVTLMRRSRTQMNDLVEDALMTLRPRFEERGLELGRGYADGSDLAIEVDTEKIRQVLLNIMDNALKHTPRGGRIEISIEKQEAELQVGVHDTGPGIHPEYLDHVFERFKQIEALDGGNHGGLGIGLSLVRSIVDLHGGRTWSESPGRLTDSSQIRGASFYFTIPLRVPAEASRSGPPSEPPHAGA